MEGEASHPELSPDGQYAVYSAPLATGRLELRVVRLADLQPFPFAVVLGDLEWTGRAKWIDGGRAIAFIGYDEGGRRGVFAQAFAFGTDTRDSRRPLVPFVEDEAVETFAVSPDGTHVVMSIPDDSASIVMTDPLELD